MRTLIITTGIEKLILNNWLPSLRSKGEYEGDILIIDYENTKGCFTEEGIKSLLKDSHILFKREKKIYTSFSSDRHRAYLKHLENIWENYDVILQLDGDDMEFCKPIQPLFELAKDTLCFSEEPRINESYYFKCTETLPIESWEAIKDKEMFNGGMWIGPSDSVMMILRLFTELLKEDSRFGSDQWLLNIFYYYYGIPFKNVGRVWNCQFRDGVRKVNDRYFFDYKGKEEEIAIIHFGSYWIGKHCVDYSTNK